MLDAINVEGYGEPEAVPYYSVRELTSHFVVDCQPLNEGRKLGIASALHHAKRKWHVPLFKPPRSPATSLPLISLQLAYSHFI